MELKKENLGARIFVKKLGREVEICEENKVILYNFGFVHLFKNDINDNLKSGNKSNGKRRVKTINK